MRKALRLLALMSSMVLGGSAMAGELSSSTQKIEELLTSNQPIAAYDALQELNDMVWAKLPLKIQNAQYVKDIRAYRQFTPKDRPVFKPNEPHVIYAEPIGFTYGKDSEGNPEAGFLIDFVLSNEQGQVLLQRSDFLTVDIPLGARNKEVHLKLTVDLSGLGEGKYESRYVVKDKYSEKQDQISLPFSISE